MIMRVIKVFIMFLAFSVLIAPHGVMAKVFGHRKVKARPKIMVVTLVKKISEMGCLEPLMIRAVVFKMDRSEGA